MSARVSMMLTSFDLLFVMSHANGTPAKRSRRETEKASRNEALRASPALDTRYGFSRVSGTSPNFKRIPAMEGSRTMAKKNRTEAE